MSISNNYSSTALKGNANARKVIHSSSLSNFDLSAASEHHFFNISSLSFSSCTCPSWSSSCCCSLNLMCASKSASVKADEKVNEKKKEKKINKEKNNYKYYPHFKVNENPSKIPIHVIYKKSNNNNIPKKRKNISNIPIHVVYKDHNKRLPKRPSYNKKNLKKINSIITPPSSPPSNKPKALILNKTQIGMDQDNKKFKPLKFNYSQKCRKSYSDYLNKKLSKETVIYPKRNNIMFNSVSIATSQEYSNKDSHENDKSKLEPTTSSKVLKSCLKSANSEKSLIKEIKGKKSVRFNAVTHFRTFKKRKEPTIFKSEETGLLDFQEKYKDEAFMYMTTIY